jgi:hypothetical protein
MVTMVPSVPVESMVIHLAIGENNGKIGQIQLEFLLLASMASMASMAMKMAPMAVHWCQW